MTLPYYPDFQRWCGYKPPTRLTFLKGLHSIMVRTKCYAAALKQFKISLAESTLPYPLLMNSLLSAHSSVKDTFSMRASNDSFCKRMRLDVPAILSAFRSACSHPNPLLEQLQR